MASPIVIGPDGERKGEMLSLIVFDGLRSGKIDNTYLGRDTDDVASGGDIDNIYLGRGCDDGATGCKIDNT